MAIETRSSSSLLNGMSVLEDLDAFLEEEEELVGVTSQPCLTPQQQELDRSCEACRQAPRPAVAALSSGHLSCLGEMLNTPLAQSLQGVRTEEGATLAHLAARRGDLEALRLVLRADSSLCEVGDGKGATPLHMCAYHGHVECLRCLLEVEGERGGRRGRGRGRLARDQDGATAVHFAAASGHTECLRVLVEEGGGDPNERTNGGETPGEDFSIAMEREGISSPPPSPSILSTLFSSSLSLSLPPSPSHPSLPPSSPPSLPPSSPPSLPPTPQCTSLLRMVT